MLVFLHQLVYEMSLEQKMKFPRMSLSEIFFFDCISMSLLNCFFKIRFKSNFLVRKVGGDAMYFHQQAQYPFGLLSVMSSLIT